MQYMDDGLKVVQAQSIQIKIQIKIQNRPLRQIKIQALGLNP